ncbi:hypothetical protein [Tritonibacter mobilis]|uniref:hypothetical protein n=1 Tax=Tritonibacter mobilis TaxID=379347 RepID=UPI001C07F38D|nr:hypothetical protein [Tritonibacter mobilis]MBU3036597.1 hypothetical protein [Tritonibacter mobilis]WHQ84445.1 hypothetical protein OMR53_20050 [Tritonibacter mobilis]
MLGGLVGGALSFLGGRSARKQQEKMYWQNRWDNLPEGIRANAEAAGFNPLVFAGPGVGNGAGYQPTMGHELSTAGQVVTDASLALENQKIRRAELELENKRLEELVKRNTLRPSTPGVYGDRNVATRQNTGDPVQRRNGVGDPSDIVVGGLKVSKDEKFSDAEDVETRYGDVLSSLYGVGVLAGDAWKTYEGSPLGKARMRLHDTMVNFWRGNPKGKPHKPDEFEQHARKIQSQNPYYRP